MHKHLFRLLKTDWGVPKSLQCSSFLKGTVLYQCTWLLHCSHVFIYGSCSMKYLAEAKHMHPVSSGWGGKSIFPPSSGSRNGLGVTVNNTWKCVFVSHFNSSSLISLHECLVMCFSKHTSGVPEASGIIVRTDSARGVTRSLSSHPSPSHGYLPGWRLLADTVWANSCQATSRLVRNNCCLITNLITALWYGRTLPCDLLLFLLEEHVEQINHYAA